MRIPKYIKTKMHRIAELQTQSAILMKEVEEYLTQNGYDIETIRDGSGCSLEELDYGNDVTEELCKRLEDGFGIVASAMIQEMGYSNICIEPAKR